jgi:undecaprenyl-diphosphatase
VAAAVVAVVLFGLLSRRLRVAEAGLVALAGAAVALLGNSIVSSIWTRPRPFVAHRASVHLLVHHPPDASFPSDHSAALAAITVSLFLGRQRTLGSIFALWTVLVGVARVYVGEHYPGDILGGWLVGIAAGLLAGWIFKRVRIRERMASRVPSLAQRGGS